MVRRFVVPHFALACAILALSCAGAARPPAIEAPAETAGAEAPPSNAAVLDAIASSLPPLPRLVPANAPERANEEGRPRPRQDDSALAEAVTSGRYVAIEHAGFVVRLPADEAAAMTPYVVELLDRVRVAFDARYGLALPSPLRIDGYGDRAAYRERLGGRLPFDVDGAYGEGVVVVLSPGAGAGNWGETLVHEVAHAYQDAASNGRAPAWLCEGLAELDTGRMRPEWNRELDPELAEVVAGPARGVLARIARSLATPTSLRGLGGAYAAATAFVAFLEQRAGPSAMPRLLAAYAAGADDVDAIASIASGTLADVEEAFVASITPRVERARASHLAELVTTPIAATADARSPVDDVETLVRRASLALVEGRIEAARRGADAALSLDPRALPALHLRLRVAVVDREAGAAEALLARMGQGERPIYEVCVALARVALLRGDLVAAARETDRAIGADAERIDAWDLRLRLADRGVAGVDRAAARRAIVDLDARAGGLAFDLVAEAARGSDGATVRRHGERLLYVMPGRAELHRLLLDAYREAGDAPSAAREAAVLEAIAAAGR